MMNQRTIRGRGRGFDTRTRRRSAVGFGRELVSCAFCRSRWHQVRRKLAIDIRRDRRVFQSGFRGE